MTNPLECRVATGGGFVVVPCCWRGGGLAVTARAWTDDSGAQRVGPGWRVTHEASGYSIMGPISDADWDMDDFPWLIAYAEHMAKATDWSTVTPERVSNDATLRTLLVDAARAFVASHERGG